VLSGTLNELLPNAQCQLQLQGDRNKAQFVCSGNNSTVTSFYGQVNFSFYDVVTLV